MSSNRLEDGGVQVLVDGQWLDGWLDLNDVVNSMIVEGFATWEHGSARLLRPTVAGRLWLRDTLRELTG